MTKNGDAVAIYSRKSKFTGKGESIENQIELCKEYVRTQYGEDACEKVVVYEDEGFSGGNLNRPAFKRMMEAAKKHEFRAIIVYRLDRISRNVGDFSKLIEELSHLDIAFVSLREQFDTNSPMGRAMMYIASVFSQLERETIAERIRDNMHELAKTGRWLGGTTPTGYCSESVKNVTVDGKTKKSCKLKLIQEEAELVRTIYSLFLETRSLTLTEAELLRRRVTTRRGNQFTRFSIKGILQNPVYLIADQTACDYFTQQGAELFSDSTAFDGIHGILAYNRTDQEKGRATVYRPIHEWIISVGDHPGLISSAEWLRVQNLLAENRSKGYRRPRSNTALMTGLLFCDCGSRMYPKLTKRRMADGTPLYSYVCKLKERSQGSRCSGKNVNGNLLDEMVIEQVKALGEDNSIFLKNLEQGKRACVGNTQEYEKKLEALKKEHAELGKRADALVDSLAELGDSGTRKRITDRIEALGREEDALQRQIEEYENLLTRCELSDQEFEVFRLLLASFSKSVDDMTVEEKRTAIRTVIRKAVWDGKQIHLILFGASEDEIDFSSLPATLNGSEMSELPLSGEDSKCYTIIRAANGSEVGKCGSFGPKWGFPCDGE